METMGKLIGKTILVTGGTGFVGSHVTELLVAMGAHVIVPYRSHDPRSYFEIMKLSQHVLMVQCDVKDRLRVGEIMAKYEVEYVVHLAAQALVPIAYVNPWETIASNIMGTANIIEAARMTPSVRGIIIASSDKAYGKSEHVYTEDQALRGDHPYDASKAAADLISLAYAKTYHLPVVVTRFGNIYGPGDLNYSRIIPGLMHAVLMKHPLELRSDGTYVRDYVFVKDVARAYIFLLTHINEIHGRAFNISSGTPYSVRDLIHMAEKVLKKKIYFIVKNTSLNEIPKQHLNDHKIRALGWKDSVRLSVGLARTYAWYKKYKEALL